MADSYRIQKTLSNQVEFAGVGIHTGRHSTLRLTPADPNQGIVFVRTDLPDRPQIFAHYDFVVSTTLATSLGYRDRPEVRVATVEHLMAALFALGITNVIAELNGPEIPILDGSARPFVEAIQDTGIEAQPFTTPTLKVVKPVKIFENGAICELLPREQLRLTTSIEFPHPSIGLQTFALEVSPTTFSEQVSPARTFGFSRDLEKLRAHELAQGASLENVLAFSDDGILNPEGMRYPDECVRHKLLDALGDLALCGSWIEGELVSFRGGHSIHFALLKSLRAYKGNWEFLPAERLVSERHARKAEIPVFES